jgi:hypothetical protein
MHGKRVKVETTLLEIADNGCAISNAQQSICLDQPEGAAVRHFQASHWSALQLLDLEKQWLKYGHANRTGWLAVRERQNQAAIGKRAWPEWISERS